MQAGVRVQVGVRVQAVVRVPAGVQAGLRVQAGVRAEAESQPDTMSLGRCNDDGTGAHCHARQDSFNDVKAF